MGFGFGRVRDRDFTLRGLVTEFAVRGLKVDYHPVWSGTSSTPRS
jgi:hypothetical protein